jgi:ammonium transporter, Amt family
MLGRRRGFPMEPMPPPNLVYSVTGASLLWVGWLGFNGGSALAANGTAALALLNTQVAGATGALAWLAAEWEIHERPSVLGIISGAVAGLVAITPACAYVPPLGAAVIGWSAAATAGILFGIRSMIGLRVTREVEIEGLDVNLHGEIVR